MRNAIDDRSTSLSAKFQLSDPAFVTFCAFLKDAFDDNGVPEISQSTLNGLWFLRPTFCQYWSQRPTRKASDGIIWILAHHGVDEMQAQLVMWVWASKHQDLMDANDWLDT